MFKCGECSHFQDELERMRHNIKNADAIAPIQNICKEGIDLEDLKKWKKECELQNIRAFSPFAEKCKNFKKK